MKRRLHNIAREYVIAACFSAVVNERKLKAFVCEVLHYNSVVSVHFKEQSSEMDNNSYSYN